MVRMMAVVGLLNLKVIPGGDNADCEADIAARVLKVGERATFATIRLCLSEVARHELPPRYPVRLAHPRA